MLSNLQNNFAPMNRAHGPHRPGGLGGPQGLTPAQPQGPGGADQGQLLKALATLLMSQFQGLAGGGSAPPAGGGCSGPCPVNFDSSFGGGGATATANAGGSPNITVNGQPANTNGSSTSPGNTSTNNSNTGSPVVNINAKKIKNSNIIVNGENVTATAGKKNNKPA